VSTQEAERETESNESPSPVATTTPTPEGAEGAPEGDAKVAAAATTDSSAEADATSSESAPAEEAVPAAASDPVPSDATSAPVAVATADAPKPAVAKATPSTTSSTAESASTAGQRIAAQRAAKAAKKAADKARRGEEAEAARIESDEAALAAGTRGSSGPDEVELRAAEVTHFVESHSNAFLRGFAAVAVVAVVALGVNVYLQKRDEAAGWALAHAVAASSARTGAAPETPDGRLRFGDEAMRDREALRRFRKVVSDYPSSDAARYARVAIANYLIGESKFGDAHSQLRAARSGLDGDPRLDAAILEANGLAFLGERKYAEAQQEFDRLARVDRPRNADLADYLLARTAYERGDRNGAKTKLTTLLDRLDDEGANPGVHVEEQARNLLRQIDPSAVPQPAGGGGLDFNSLTPEMIQQLLRAQGGGQ